MICLEMSINRALSDQRFYNYNDLYNGLFSFILLHD